ncbi:MAG: hypothetical protein QXQ52_00145 [Candidatus Methanomethylicaceae archaeon]
MRINIIKAILILFLIISIQNLNCEENNFQLKDVNWSVLNIGVGNSTCEIVLRYNGDEPCNNIVAELDVSEISEKYTTITETYNNYIEKGEILYLRFTFDVSSSCKLGWYEVPLKLCYNKNGRVFWEYFKIILTINGKPNLEVLLNKNNIIRGLVNEIEVNIVNKGDGLARNIILTIQSQDVYLTIINGSEFRRDFLAPLDSWNISIKALAQLNIRDGTNIIVNLRYEDQNNNVYTKSITFGFKVEEYKEPKFNINVNTTRISPGITNFIMLIIKNNGSDFAKDLVVKINPTTNQLTLVGNNTFTKSYLEIGEEFEIPLMLYLEPKTYGSLPIYITLNYKDSRNASYQDSITIGLLSEEESSPKIEIFTKSNELNPNSINKVIIEVKNTGKKAAKDLSINLASQSPQIAVIIGSGIAIKDILEPNETWEIEKEVFIQPNVYGGVPLYVQVSYEDELKNKFTYTTPIGFEIKGEPSIAISSAYYIPSPVFPGDKLVRVVCVLVNNGNYTAQDVEVTLGRIDNIIYPSYAGSDRFRIPFLTVGGTITIEFRINVFDEVEAGYYELPINIKTKSEVYNTSLPLTIYEKANLIIDKIYFDKEVVPGSRSVKLFLDIKNIGNSTAENVRISLISAYITGSTVTVLGNLPGGSKRTVMMEVDISERTNPGLLDVDIEITWNQEGRSLTKSITVEVPIKEVKMSIYLWIILPLIIITIILLRKKIMEKIKVLIHHFS